MIDDKLLTIHDQISRKYSNQVARLAKPLADFLNITYFSYQRVGADGRYNLLTSSPAFLEYYLSKQFFMHDPFLVSPHYFKNGKNVYIMSDDYDLFDEEGIAIIRNIEESFNFRQSLLVLIRDVDHIDIFVFSTNSPGREGMSKLLINIDLLERFIDHFYNKADRMLCELDEIGANIADIRGLNFKEIRDAAIADVSMRLGERDRFLEAISPEESILRAGMQSLTSRENECLYWMAQGKTADETASLLSISKRTVECHRESCRKKLGSHYTFSNLLYLLGKYDLLQ